MNCAKRVVTVLFLFGMTFTSFIPIVSADQSYCKGFENGYKAYVSGIPNPPDPLPTIIFYEGDGSSYMPSLCCDKDECGEDCSLCSISYGGPCEDNPNGYQSVYNQGRRSACTVPDDTGGADDGASAQFDCSADYNATKPYV